jgi:hypothetical protein
LPIPGQSGNFHAYIDKKHRWRVKSSAGTSSHPITDAELPTIEASVREYGKRIGVEVEVTRSTTEPTVGR